MSNIQTRCPNCHKAYQVPQDRLGKQARCNNCRQMFTLEMAADETIGWQPADSKAVSQPPPLPPPIPPSARSKSGSAGGSQFQPDQTMAASAPPMSIGPYKVRGRLGSGGMGVVWLAHDPALQRDVAVKVLRVENAVSPQYLERFLREARLAARLHHTNAVTVYQAGVDGKTAYIAMEYVEGQSLDKVVSRGKPMPWRDATAAVRDAAAGLAAAHKLGLIHRDVKPANLMRTADGVTKGLKTGHH